MSIPHTGRLASPELVPDFCRRAEEAGFDGLWGIDHLVVPKEMSSTYTLARRPAVIESSALRATMGLNLELVSTLAVAAAVTTRVRLGTSVAVLPLRNPVLNAKQLATIDLYSHGRLVYGVGVGWLREEADALGMAWDDRGQRSEEHIAILRTLWEGDDEWVSFDGAYQSVPLIAAEPRPGRRIPVLIGGHSEIALDRAARIGDGWIAAGMSPDRLSGALDALARACESHARDRSDLWVVCGTRVQLDASRPGDVLDTLRKYVDLGVDHVQATVSGATAQELLDMLSRWGDEVLLRLHEHDDVSARRGRYAPGP